MKTERTAKMVKLAQLDPLEKMVPQVLKDPKAKLEQLALTEPLVLPEQLAQPDQPDLKAKLVRLVILVPPDLLDLLDLKDHLDQRVATGLPELKDLPDQLVLLAHPDLSLDTNQALPPLTNQPQLSPAPSLTKTNQQRHQRSKKAIKMNLYSFPFEHNLILLMTLCYLANIRLNDKV